MSEQLNLTSYYLTAYVLRFVHNVRRRTTRSESRSGELTAEEISEAEQRWIKELQRSITRKEKFKQIKSLLDLFEDTSGILRCCGRLENSRLPYESKYPILLAADHHYTRLVIRRCHEEVMHNGVQATLAQLRSNFWVIKGSQVVKKTLSNCSICKNFFYQMTLPSSTLEWITLVHCT